MSQPDSSESRREIASRLARVRKQAGLSQAEMAAAMEVPVRTYQSYEQGLRDLPGAFYPRLRHLFQIDPAWMMEGEAAGPQRRENTVNEEVWVKAFSAVDRAIAQAKAKVTTEKKVALVRSVYKEILKTGSISEEDVSNLVGLAS